MDTLIRNTVKRSSLPGWEIQRGRKRKWNDGIWPLGFMVPQQPEGPNGLAPVVNSDVGDYIRGNILPWQNGMLNMAYKQSTLPTLNSSNGTYCKDNTIPRWACKAESRRREGNCFECVDGHLLRFAVDIDTAVTDVEANGLGLARLELSVFFDPMRSYPPRVEYNCNAHLTEFYNYRAVTWDFDLPGACFGDEPGTIYAVMIDGVEKPVFSFEKPTRSWNEFGLAMATSRGMQLPDEVLCHDSAILVPEYAQLRQRVLGIGSKDGFNRVLVLVMGDMVDAYEYDSMVVQADKSIRDLVQQATNWVKLYDDRLETWQRQVLQLRMRLSLARFAVIAQEQNAVHLNDRLHAYTPWNVLQEIEIECPGILPLDVPELPWWTTDAYRYVNSAFWYNWRVDGCFRFSEYHIEDLGLPLESIGAISVTGNVTLETGNDTRTLPESIGGLDVAGDLEIHCIPESFGGLSALPESFGGIHVGRDLLIKCKPHYGRLGLFEALPESFGAIVVGRDLIFKDTNLHALPESFGEINVGRHLVITGNRNLKMLPESFWDFTVGGNLDLSNNNLQSLPESFGDLTVGGNLDLSDNKLQSLPESFGELLTVGGNLDLYNNELQWLPESFGGNTVGGVIDLGNNRILTPPASNLSGVGRQVSTGRQAPAPTHRLANWAHRMLRRLVSLHTVDD